MIMKRKFLTSLFVLLCFTTMVLAQNPIADIRKHYAEAQERVAQNEKLMNAEEEYPTPNYRQYNYVTLLPGSGRHEERLMMYEKSEENDYGECVRKWIDFAIYKYNYGSRAFYEEFLYDENEEVEFVYAVNPDMQDFLGGEFRFYLKDGKLVKVLVKLRDNQTDNMEVQYEGKDIPETYKSQYQIYIDRANQIRKLCATARAL